MATDLILLGTAAGPTPKVGRHPPAQALLVDGRCYLVDCGNGVAGQLTAGAVPLSSLEAVFITHHHSDHNADFGTLFLLAWSQFDHPVTLVGPKPLKRMFDGFLDVHREDINVRVEDEGRPNLIGLVDVFEIDVEGIVYMDSRVRVTAALVSHPPLELAYAYRFDTSERSVVITGDTIPCPSLIALSKGADVLVHGAVYEQDLSSRLGNTNARRLLPHLLETHSTVADAGRTADAAGVKTLVLSHLFPSDPTLVTDAMWLEAARETYQGEIVVGKDLLVV